MPVYEVVAVDKVEQKPDTGKGVSISEDLRVKDETGEVVSVNLWRPGSPPPSTVGQRYEGTVRVDPKWGPKLEIPRPKNTGNPAAKGRSPEDRALDREKNRSIMGESALKTAVEYAGVLARADRLPVEFTGASVVQLAEVFYGFIERKTQEGS